MSQADSVPTIIAPGEANGTAPGKPRRSRKPTGIAGTPARAMAAVDAVLVMIEKAAKDGHIETLERLMAWRDKQIALEAELAFNDARAAAQAEMTPIRADAVNTHAGNSRYASLAAMDDAVRAIYTGHGFGLSFDTADVEKPDTVRIVCDVSHRDGHTRRYHLDMPADGKGAKGGDVMTRTHATGSAITYGRRYLLGMIFNLAVSRTQDDDGNAAGQRPKPQQSVPQVSRQTPRFEDLLRDEFPSPNRTACHTRRGPARIAAELHAEIANHARDAAREGRDAFREFCLSITKPQYDNAVRPILAELERIVNAAELDIPTFLDRRGGR